MCRDYTITPFSSGNNPLKSALDWFSVKKTFRHPDSGEVSVTCKKGLWFSDAMRDQNIL